MTYGCSLSIWQRLYCPLCFDRSLKIYPNIRISHNSSESLCRLCATGSASPPPFPTVAPRSAQPASTKLQFGFFQQQRQGLGQLCFSWQYAEASLRRDLTKTFFYIWCFSRWNLSTTGLSPFYLPTKRSTNQAMIGQTFLPLHVLTPSLCFPFVFLPT